MQLYEIYNLTRDIPVAHRVRLAATSAERRRGLLGVTKLDKEEGLWIRPCEAVHTFGMKIPIDIIFLDREYRVRKIQREVGPNRIAFCLLASSVLELAAGSSASAGTEVNDWLAFLPEPRRDASLQSCHATSIA